jgi:hypothetical protein
MGNSDTLTGSRKNGHLKGQCFGTVFLSAKKLLSGAKSVANLIK